MRDLNQPRPHSTAPTGARRGSARSDARAPRRPRVQRVSDAVVANYIRDISVRRGRGVAQPT